MTIEEFAAMAAGKLPVFDVCGPGQRMGIREELAKALREEAGRCWRSIQGESDQIEKLNEIIDDLRGQISELRQREQDMIVAHQAEVSRLQERIGQLERTPQRLSLNGKYNGKYKTRDGRSVDVTSTEAFPHGVAFILGVCHVYDPNGLATRFLPGGERCPGADLVELIQEARP